MFSLLKENYFNKSILNCYVKIQRTEQHNDIVCFKSNLDSNWNTYEVGYNDSTEKYFLEIGNIESNLLFDVENHTDVITIASIVRELFFAFRSDDNNICFNFNGTNLEIIGLNMVNYNDKLEMAPPITQNVPCSVDKNTIYDNFKDPLKYVTYETSMTKLDNSVKIVTCLSEICSIKHILKLWRYDGNAIRYIKSKKENILYVVAETNNMSCGQRNELLSVCKEQNVQIVRSMFRNNSYNINNSRVEMQYMSGPVSYISLKSQMPDSIKSTIREYVELDCIFPQLIYHIKRLNADVRTKLIVVYHDVNDELVNYINDYVINPSFQTFQFTELARLVKYNCIRKPVIVMTRFRNVGEMLSENGCIVTSTMKDTDEIIQLFMEMFIQNNIFKFRSQIEEDEEVDEEENIIKAINKLKL